MFYSQCIFRRKAEYEATPTTSNLNGLYVVFDSERCESNDDDMQLRKYHAESGFVLMQYKSLFLYGKQLLICVKDAIRWWILIYYH